MNGIEVIVAAMNQKDFSLIERMNIKTDVVIANQCGRGTVEERIIDGHRVVMISTPTRGVGKNRNFGLAFAEGDILLLADEDVTYCDEMPHILEEAFRHYRNADLIVFGFQFSKNGLVYSTRIPKNGRLPFHKALKYGTYAIAVRRKSILKKSILFSELFGGGCIFSHGEDSDFIIKCYLRGLKVYGYGEVIGCTAKDVSTCFEGYGEKYFYDTGALAKHSFGILAFPYMLYMAYRTQKLASIQFRKKISLMKHGYDSFEDLIPYLKQGTPRKSM